MKRIATPLAFALLLPLAPAAGTEIPPAPETWTSQLDADHPLVGTVKRVADGRDTAPADLARAAAGARFVLLGETHDNPDHHRLQAWVIKAMAAQGRRPAVAFEMLDRDQGPALAEHLDAPETTAAGLGAAVGWSERGWPDWTLYQPIAEAALTARLPLRAADVAVAAQRAVGREGWEGTLSRAERKRLGLTQPLSKPLRENLLAALKAGHCNMMPEEALVPMARVQRLRDAVMADSLIATAKATRDGAVLIAGRGHVRADRGIPWYLRARDAGDDVLTLGIFEVTATQKDWRAYLPETPENAPPVFDYVWFTPRIDDTDHCAELMKQMRKKNNEAAE